MKAPFLCVLLQLVGFNHRTQVEPQALSLKPS